MPTVTRPHGRPRKPNRRSAAIPPVAQLDDWRRAAVFAAAWRRETSRPATAARR